jgi:hypothetical protein
VCGAGFALITQCMAQGELTPAEALRICDALASCKPKVRGHMLMHQVFNPTLIRELNKRFGSDTYNEIIASGYLQFSDETAIQIGDAQPKVLRRLLDERHQEHLRRVAAERDAAQQVSEVLLAVYVGHNTDQRNITALERALGPERFRLLCEQYLGMGVMRYNNP